MSEQDDDVTVVLVRQLMTAPKGAVAASAGSMRVRINLKFDTEVTIRHKTEPNDQDKIIVEALAEIGIPGQYKDEIGRILDGTTVVRVHPVSDELSALGARISTDLIASCTRVFSLTRWRFGAHAPANALAVRPPLWVGRGPGDRWREMPTKLIGISDHFKTLPLQRAKSAEQSVSELIADDSVEPVGHQLRREAKAVGYGNARSALVIGLASIEAGFKDLVSRLVPDAAWLLEEGPSPSIYKMLKDYLPTLPARNTFDGVVHRPPKNILTIVNKALAKRNKVAHTGAPALSHEDLKTFLAAASNLLYLFDYYAGHDWARDHITDDFLAALGT